MANLKKKERAISIAGICTNCEGRIDCHFTKGINSYIRNHKCADHISDIEITVYSCDNYKSEADSICGSESMCINCH